MGTRWEEGQRVGRSWGSRGRGERVHGDEERRVGTSTLTRDEGHVVATGLVLLVVTSR